MEHHGLSIKWTDLTGRKNHKKKQHFTMGNELKVPTMAELFAAGKQPEVLFWVGCAGSFDDRAKKITKAFVKILNQAKVEFAVLGTEESCTGDPAKRAGNEFLFQMQAVTNIEVLNGYEVKKVVTACPHCFNTIKNEYPGLGGNYEVVHHTQFLKQLLEEGRISLEGGTYKGKRITAPKKLPVRPTTDMAKEALFNIINNNYYFEDIAVLDLSFHLLFHPIPFQLNSH